MKRIILLLVCLLVILSGANAGELYRWVGDDGRVHYSDTPPADAKKASRKRFSNASAPDEELSYEARRAKENFPVTMYVSEGCVQPCIHARALLVKRGVPFSEKMLKTKTEIDQFQKVSGSADAPTLQVGKVYLGGFVESRWNSELDIAGYPKTATYRQQIAAPTTQPAIQPEAEPAPEEEQEIFDNPED